MRSHRRIHSLKIGVDVTFASVNPAGPGHYIRSLLDAFEALDFPPEVVQLAAGLESWRTSDWPYARKLHTLYRDLIWSRFELPRSALRADVNLLHAPAYFFPAVRSLPTVITLFDMATYLRQDDFRIWFRSMSRVVLPYAARHASAIITISKRSRADIVRILGIPAGKVHVTPLAADPDYRHLEPGEVFEYRNRLGIDHFILTVGTLEPRKNIPRLLEAIARLRTMGLTIPLVHAGPRGWKYNPVFERMEQLGLQDQVRFLGHVTDQELVRLYNAASVFVYPSLYEGFGLPPLEAMACGCPVVTSNTSAIPEVVGDAAILIHPEDPAAIADAIHSVLTDQDLASKMREKGLARAQQFSWERCAQQTIDVYHRVLDNPPKTNTQA